MRTIALVAAAGLLGALLSSIQLLPFLEYLNASRVLAARAAQDQPLFTNPPAAFVTAFVPDFYGTPLRHRFVLEGTNYCEQQIYAGILTWVLAAMALMHQRFRGHALFFLAAGAIGALVMYGTVVSRVAVVLCNTGPEYSNGTPACGKAWRERKERATREKHRALRRHDRSEQHHHTGAARERQSIRHSAHGFLREP